MVKPKGWEPVLQYNLRHDNWLHSIIFVIGIRGVYIEDPLLTYQEINMLIASFVVYVHLLLYLLTYDHFDAHSVLVCEVVGERSI